MDPLDAPVSERSGRSRHSTATERFRSELLAKAYASEARMEAARMQEFLEEAKAATSSNASLRSHISSPFASKAKASAVNLAYV